MNDDLVRVIPTFGNRTSLLPRRTSYAMSLELSFDCEGGTGSRFFLSSRPPQADAPDKAGGGALDHVFNRSSVQTADGIIRELPGSTDFLYARAELTKIGDEGWSLEGEALFVCNVNGMLRITYSGVVSLEGTDGDETAPFTQGQARSGTCFIATKHDTAVPSLRWMSQQQLFGAGTASTDVTRLSLSVDLYSAA